MGAGVGNGIQYHDTKLIAFCGIALFFFYAGLLCRGKV
jgi:hypothetical protein